MAVTEQNWTEAGELSLDTILWNINDKNSTISTLRSYTKKATVYNLTVDNDHTYFVGVGGVLGHNSGCDPKYSPTDKHKPGGHGTTMDLDDKTAAKVLKNSVISGKQRYGYYDGKVYEFKDDNVGGWHGYPVGGSKIPSNILRQWLKENKITKSKYNKLIKEAKDKWD